MRHEEFARCWQAAFSGAGLPTFHGERELVDVAAMERTYEVFVEPGVGQQTRPFFVTAKLSYRWDALQTARSQCNEEDLLRAVLGDDHDVLTQRPWLRVDVVLGATLPYGEPLPMPSQERRARWIDETTGRLERVERLLPEETVAEDAHGRLAVLAWQGDPVIKARCDARGALLLEGVEVSAWQAINLPRIWDDPERDEDPPPDHELERMFSRVRGALYAWMEALDHLRPTPPRS